MSEELVLLEKREAIAVVTLNRPDKLNALNWQLMTDLYEIFTELHDDSAIRGVVLTGAGEKAFAAGADIAELAQQSAVGARGFAIASQEILGFIERFPKPVIAAVNGFALGGGNELAMACHMRWAADNARFGQPEVGLGLIAGNGGTQRLARLVGKGRAIELLVSGNIIDAAEAHRIGLVNHVVAQEALLPEIENFLGTVFSKAPVAVQLSLEAVHSGLEMSQEEGIRLEAGLFGLACATEDKTEGTTAFLEKRKPAFKGQ